MISVVNKHYHKPTSNDVYIGRGSVLGNQYSHKSGTRAKHVMETRELSIQAYEIWLDNQLYLDKDPVIRTEMNRIYTLAKQGDVNLVCYCHPRSCHGDVIKKLIESKLKR